MDGAAVLKREKKILDCIANQAEELDHAGEIKELCVAVGVLKKELELNTKHLTKEQKLTNEHLETISSSLAELAHTPGGCQAMTTMKANYKWLYLLGGCVISANLAVFSYFYSIFARLGLLWPGDAKTLISRLKDTLI